MACAKRSFPVPLSPNRRTLEFIWAAIWACLTVSRNSPSRPMMSSKRNFALAPIILAARVLARLISLSIMIFPVTLFMERIGLQVRVKSAWEFLKDILTSTSVRDSLLAMSWMILEFRLQSAPRPLPRNLSPPTPNTFIAVDSNDDFRDGGNNRLLKAVRDMDFPQGFSVAEFVLYRMRRCDDHP